MNEVKWKGEAVFYANNAQFRENCGGFQRYNDTLESWQRTISGNELNETLRCKDFQLNEIRQGDCIEAPELDNEKKYNDAVEAFELFKYLKSSTLSYDDVINLGGMMIDDQTTIHAETPTYPAIERKITYSQLMAIGKLKRAMIEKSAPKIAPDLTPDVEHKKSIDYLNECAEVQKQRSEQYDSKGTGERSFYAAAKAFNAMTGQNLKGSDVCLLLACVKAVRQYSDPTRVHEDSLLDLVSYASLWAEELNKELK
jgi:hypothetical protein